MTTRAQKQFEDQLCRLFKIRTHQLRAYLWPTTGKAAHLTKTRLRRSIARLQEIATDAYLASREAKKVFKSFDHKRQWHSKRNKGFGVSAKKRAFKNWYERKITTKNSVYVFWDKSKCLYVGRTLNGKGRPTSHFEKYWFRRATRVDIFGFDRKRDVPKYECVLTHRWKPAYSRITPSRKRYYSPCPICVGRKHILMDTKSMFRFR
jgi:hypothetical protein